MSKSRPLYGPLRYDATGRRHLLVLQTDAPPVQDFPSEASAAMETWAVAGKAGTCAATPLSVDQQPAGPIRLFADVPEMFAALRERLGAETMGLRLYAVGDETFLWDLFGLASAQGVGRQEVVLSRIGAPVRRVSCVHCATMNEDVRTDHVVCRGCGLTLSVRDHFSRRLSAFMGVHADAEAPGDLPQAQPLAS